MDVVALCEWVRENDLDWLRAVLAVAGYSGVREGAPLDELELIDGRGDARR
jgi:hypothetical protein